MANPKYLSLFAICLILVCFATTEIERAEAVVAGSAIRLLLRTLNFKKIWDAIDNGEKLHDLLPNCTELNSNDSIVCPGNDDDTKCIKQCNNLGVSNGWCLDFIGFKARCICSDFRHCFRN